MAEVILSPGWATYLRVSDEDTQTPERSFAMQRQRIEEQLLNPSDVKFKQEYRDILTGSNPNRKDYQQMLADAAAGRFSHLGLYRADRFGRNAMEGLQAATTLISQGIKVRVANMPSLMTETPDGFFMFLLSMGLAQREVEVLKQRTADGMEAKLRAGGWPHKAPEGYVNRERQVKSNKYERWVEQDPETSQMIRVAWDLLLTDRYSMVQICEELHARGYTRAEGRPWAWDDPKKNDRVQAKYRLHQFFHNPFYAGWAVSKRFGIRMGEVRGQWEPIVSTEELEKGIAILRKNDLEKSRAKKRFYLLRNLLWIRVNGKTFKLYGSSPKPRERNYAYYITYAKPDGKKVHVPCATVDDQIPEWLSGITVQASLLPTIREIYRGEVKNVVGRNKEEKIAEIKKRLSQLLNEEARLGRLFITGKISEQTYDKLRTEWREKTKISELNLAEIQRETSIHLDDLDLALVLMSRISELYERLEEEHRAALLRILAKRIIIDTQGKIVDYELNSPFSYLDRIVANLGSILVCRSSEQVALGVLFRSLDHAAPGVRVTWRFFYAGICPLAPHNINVCRNRCTGRCTTMTETSDTLQRVMVIAAHPDDPEFGCAGTVLKWAQDGKHVTYVLLTSGDKGSHDPDLRPGRLAGQREDEQRAAARDLGVKDVIFFRYPDGLLENNLDLRRQLANLLRQHKPHIVTTIDPWRHYQLHPDHRAAGQAALDAIYAAREWYIFPEQLVDDMEPWRVKEVYLFWTENADYWEDISCCIEGRISALAKHASQVGLNVERLTERVRNAAQKAGEEPGFSYAEGFKQIKF